MRTQWAKAFTTEAMQTFRFAFEHFAADDIDPHRLRQSLSLYERQRTLVRKLYDLRRENSRIMRAREFYAVVMSSMLMPKQEHVSLLETLLQTLPSRQPATNGHVRLVLAGNLCEPVRDIMLDTIEESGAVVVDDDLYVGSRAFALAISLEGDPFEALVNAYLTGLPPCPTKIDHEKDWGDYLVRIVKQSQGQGVINIVCRECEPHYFSLPKIQQCLREEGIPELVWEEEPGMKAVGQLRTRVQAFVEMLQS